MGVVYQITVGGDIDRLYYPLLQTFLSQGSEGYLTHNTTLWFVTCLFVTEMLYYSLIRLKTWQRLIICLALMTVGLVLIGHKQTTNLPWSIDMALCAVPFYCMGNIIGEKKERYIAPIKEKKYLCLLFSLILFFIAALVSKYNGSVSMGHRHLGNSTMVFYLNALIGIIAMVLLSLFLSYFDNPILSYVKWIGKNSFVVMAVQTPIKGVVLSIIGKFLDMTANDVGNSMPLAVIAFLITLLLVTCVTQIVIKMNLMPRLKNVLRV